MAKRKTQKAKNRSVKHSRKNYHISEGNSNEFLLIFSGGAFVLFSVIYLTNAWW